MQHRFQPVLQLSDFAPADIASRARSFPGMVFFDSAREMDRGNSLSIIAIQPDALFEGNIFETVAFGALQQALARLSEDYGSVDDGLPGPILAGTVEYDGTFHFASYRRVLVYRHREALWYADGDWWREITEHSPLDARLRAPLQFLPVTSKEAFCAAVLRAQEYIASGDIYQVNLSHKLESAWSGGDPWLFYEALRHYSPAPYGAFLTQPNRSILSSSPELFLHFSGRNIRTRPIKGTRPRRSTLHADERSAFDLLTSPKEVAELVMITDLERNDLGQFCEWGSVEVTELLKLERHEQVFHLVSTVEGRLREGIDPVSALRACFPGGSISGAPKRRAREIIAELEPVPRGLYTGAAGWFGAGGESAFNILIRTLVIEENRAHFHVGAGVVADSSPEAEWQETWDKAAGLLLAAARIEPKAGANERLCVATLPEQC
jgi:anthranilate/para-aminobenzoate synthase component I